MTFEEAWSEFDRSFERLLLVPARPIEGYNAAIRRAFKAGYDGVTYVTAASGFGEAIGVAFSAGHAAGRRDEGD